MICFTVVGVPSVPSVPSVPFMLGVLSNATSRLFQIKLKLYMEKSEICSILYLINVKKRLMFIRLLNEAVNHGSKGFFCKYTNEWRRAN